MDTITGFGCIGVFFLVVYVVWEWIHSDDSKPENSEASWQHYYDEHLKNEPDQSLNWSWHRRVDLGNDDE